MVRIKTFIENQAKIIDSSIGPNSSWVRYGSNIRHSQIGNHVYIGIRADIQHTYISNHSQIAVKTKFRGSPNAPISIGSFVWVGAGAIIEAGIIVGEGAIIGSGAYVTKNVAPYTIVAGRPARIIKLRPVKNDACPTFSDFLRTVSQGANYFLPKNLNCQAGNNCYITADVDYKDDLTIGSNTIMIGKKPLVGTGGIKVSSRVKIGNNVVIEGAGGVTIGEDVIIEDDVILLSTSHHHNLLSMPMTKSPLIIEAGSIIGSGAIINAGLIVGAKSKVAANSVVVKNVPSAIEVSGCPAMPLI
jgi:acetyltransferase-like isoleucine patch superfamily enzyme